MQTTSELFLRNLRNLPIWAKQVITAEITGELSEKLKEFTSLTDNTDLFQYMKLDLTTKARKELLERNMGLSDGYYTFLSDVSEGNNIFEITLKNNWALADTAKIFCRLLDLDYFNLPDYAFNKNVAVALFIAGKIRTGEFLNRIGKINRSQLDYAIKYQRERNDEGVHIKMASVLIKLGFITDEGLDSLLLLKEEAKKRLPVGVGFTSVKYHTVQEEKDQILRLQKEISRLENENLIMKKRLKKMLHISE